MLKRALALLVSAAALLFFVSFNSQWDQPEGRLLLYVRQDGDTFVIESASVELDATPLPDVAGMGSFTFRDNAGRTIATGPALIRNRIFHDHSFGPEGALEGYSEAITDSFVVSVPYCSYAESVQISFPNASEQVLGDLQRILRKSPRPSASSAATYEYRPQYKDYLQSIFQGGEHLLPEEMEPFGVVSPTGQTKKVYIRIEVKNLPSVVDGFIQAWFYKEKNGSWESDKYISLEGFNTTHTVELEPGFYRAHVMASAYIPGGYGASVRIGATKQDLFVRTGETDAAHPATLSINYNYLTTISVVNEHGQMVSARINVVDHVKKSKSMWSTAAANTIANGFEPQEVQFRLPAGAKVFAVYPWDVELYAETILVQKIKRNDNNEVTVVLPSLGKVKGSALKQIWSANSGNASSSATKGKMNIIFMPDAYTNGHGSFTDKNNNGVWDGDLLLDDNGNGKRDTGPDPEIYIDRNLNDKYDPPEPFKDINGDGICNRYERAKFEFHCAFNTAALISIQPFKRFSNRINVFTYWVPSKHGVQRITESKPWQNMETAFGVYCIEGGCFRTAKIDNPSLVYNTAKEALPDYTVPIVVVRDPFTIMRSNASFNFGRVLLSATDSRSGNVLIHELGHGIGKLEDEYASIGGTYTGIEPWAVNLTTETDPSKVKWKRFIKGDIEVPTPQDYDGYGIFEGGAYGSEGIYRPTPTSMMRDTDYLFYKVNEAQLKKVLKTFKK